MVRLTTTLKLQNDNPSPAPPPPHPFCSYSYSSFLPLSFFCDLILRRLCNSTNHCGRLGKGTPELPQRTQKYKVAVLEEQIAELTKMNRELQDRFDESEAKIAETEKGHLQNAAACKAQIADAEARLLDEAMKAEMLLEEERLLTQRALETLEDDKVRLQDELDEMHSLLEELSADRTATAAAAAASEAAAQAAIAAARDAASTAVQDQEATSLSAELAQMGTAEEVTALRTKLDAADAENDQLKETQTALEAKAREVGALQTKLDAVDAEKAALEAKAREVGVLRSKLDAVDAEKAALEAKARELWSKLDAANAEKAALEARAREMGALHYKLDGLDAIEAECKAQAREVGALQTKLDAVDAEKAALEAKARELLAKLVEVDGENAALEARAREAGTLRTKLDAAAAEKGQLQNTKSALEAKVAEVVALTTQLNVARTENGRLEEGLNALEAKLTASEARATVAEAKAAEQLERAVAAEAKRRRAAAAESKLEQMSKRLAEADRKAKEYQAALVAAAAAAAAERQAAASKVAQLQSILHDDMADNEATLAAATAIMQRKIADAEANTKRLQERLDATADDQNATIEALETSNTSLQCELVEVKRTKFKGMTVSEQAAIFDQQVELKMELDEMHDELVVSKAAAAKAMWEKEHERLYQKSRNRILFNILSGPLSAVDREQVVQILMETEGTPDAAEGSDESGGSSGGDRGDTDGSTLPGSRTKIYDVAAPGGPSADAPAATRSMIDGKPVVALYLYAASHPDELDLMENEPLTILDAPNTDAGWITVQNAAGMQGVVPEAYVGPDDGMSAAGDGDGEDVDDFVVVKDNAGKRGAGAGAGVIVPEDAYGSSGVNYVLASASTSPPHPST